MRQPVEEIWCTETTHGFRTRRLEVRLATRDDVEAIVDLQDEEEARRWQGWTNWTRDRMRQRVRRDITASPRRLQFFSIVQRDGGAIVGSRLVSFAPGCAVVGTTIARDSRGQGLGTEELRGLLRFLHRHVGVREVRAATDRENQASRRQLWSAGMQPVEGAVVHIELPDGRVPDAVTYRSRVWFPRRSCVLH